MVKIRNIQQQESLTAFDEWLSHLNLEQDKSDYLVAIPAQFDLQDLSVVEETRAREMVEILASLNMDGFTLRAAYLFPYLDAELINRDALQSKLGKDACLLIDTVTQLDAISLLNSKNQNPTAQQIDKIRRMLLAMVEDVRAVVIKLAERICYLHSVKNADEETRVLAAKECASIYAPLANRLGIGQLKWEIEDFCFRYQHPDTYKQIASMLDERRVVRETYIRDFVDDVQAKLDAAGVKGTVVGRPKHIYSIWKKMQKKNLKFDKLFDVRAVRITVDQLQDCYSVLGVVHTNWHHLPAEFDDYVANPKANGYQSIHTVVVGPLGKTIEIQIRTHQMHEDSELGVAAHWKYKEGEMSGRSGSYDEKITWLRRILQWQESASENGELVEEVRSQVFEDRVYVFTPKGDVVDLPSGSTPLDFAYYIHSNVGHRCIGAKISGRIVPFQYQLQTGEQVEILTSKQPNPRRDWLNPNLGYVKSSRARSKIQHWFKQQDRDKNLLAGRELVERELERVGMVIADLKDATSRFNVNSADDLMAAIGAGDVRLHQVINYLQGLSHHQKPASDDLDPRVLNKAPQRKKKEKSDIVVSGVGNLMTHIARCCQPVPGDAIVGFITQGRGISVHREECEQVKQLLNDNPQRLIDVNWGESYSQGYTSTVRIVAYDRSGLLRDVTTILANEKINVMGMTSKSDIQRQIATLDIELEFYNADALGRVLTKIEQMDDVYEARRLHGK